MGKAEELNDWSYRQKCEHAVQALKKNGFGALYCQNSEEAYHYIINEAAEAVSVGFGGSLTIAELKLHDKLKGMGKEILNHGAPGLSVEEKLAVTHQQLSCDLFLTSTNALTLSGTLVNIDGHGNRAAAMFFGPRKVIVVAGRNKLVAGGTDEALQRIKHFAAPPNARRLQLATPCASTGFCCDCDSPQRICRVTTIIDRKPRNSDIRVLVVNEEMGL